MPRRGWTSVPVPDGWLQVIRGPRPPAAKWTKTGPNPPSGQRTQPERRPQQPPRAPVDPDTALLNARARVTKLEAAVLAMGESDPEHPGLQVALKKARSQVQEKPVQDRIGGTELFLERARKRVAAARQEVEKAKEGVVSAEGKLALEEEEVRKAEAPLLVLKQEANHMPASPRPTVPADLVQELTKLQSLVQELQRERDELRAELATHTEVQEGRPRKSNRSLAMPSPDLVMSSPTQLAVTRPGDGRELSSVMETLIDRAESAMRSAHSHPMAKRPTQVLPSCASSVLMPVWVRFRPQCQPVLGRWMPWIGDASILIIHLKMRSKWRSWMQFQRVRFGQQPTMVSQL